MKKQECLGPVCPDFLSATDDLLMDLPDNSLDDMMKDLQSPDSPLNLRLEEWKLTAASIFDEMDETFAELERQECKHYKGGKCKKRWKVQYDCSLLCGAEVGPVRERK